MRLRSTLPAMLALLVSCMSAHAGDIYRSMAKEFRQAGLRSNVKKIAVLAFVPERGAPVSDGEYVARRLTTQLVRLGKIEVVERELLEKVMDEHRLMLTGMLGDEEAKKVGRILAVDAVLSGFVSGASGDIAVHARMIDMETGRVIHASDAVERRSERAGPRAETPMEEPYVLRDALSSRDSSVEDCGAGEAEREVLERSVVAIKARYWIAKLRQPGFSYANLIDNPGSDIVTPEVRSRFYELLKRWNQEAGAPGPDAQELKLLSNTESRIRKITDACSG